jgi:protein-tyrosine phosphatase
MHREMIVEGRPGEVMRKRAGEGFCVDHVLVPGTGGAIGLHAFPGASRAGLGRPVNDEDLEVELAAIRGWGAEVLVSLLEEAEYELYGLPRLEGHMPEGLQRLSLGIADRCAPCAAWETTWKDAGPELRALLRRGGKVCLHCVGGRGRSGTVAALLLIEFGYDPEEAVRVVRAARPGAIETEAQLEYLRSKKALQA